MIQLFHDVRFDWLGNRKYFITISVILMLIGMGSAIVRQVVPGGTEAFNLGVDFKGGTVLTVKFVKQPFPSDSAVRSALEKVGIKDAVIQQNTKKPEEFLIKLAQMSGTEPTAPSATPAPATPPAPGAAPVAGKTQQQQEQAQVDPGAAKAQEALDTFGKRRNPASPTADDAYEIVSRDAVGPIAGRQLRNSAVAVTLLALVGMLMFIAFRFEWTYGAAAVIAVFHDVLVTLGVFSLMQWEISLTVIAALLTIVGFSVNDSIVIFDRIRENLKMRRRVSLYDLTNESINQTLSRTVITSGLVFLSVVALVLFGGEVLQGFSRALLIGVVFGTYSTVAIASPIMVWWQQRLDAAGGNTATVTPVTPVAAPSGTPRPRRPSRPVKAGRAAS
ncbi:MAG: protein translocase subunit SecF [Pyrinomonadaceae bacterium]